MTLNTRAAHMAMLSISCLNVPLSKFKTFWKIVRVSYQMKHVDSLDTGADNSLSVVVLTRINDVVKEHHFVFMSKNLKHNILFVEICNSIIHKYYTDKEIEIKLDIEFNNGCASQFKCATAFSNLLYISVGKIFIVDVFQLSTIF